MHGGAQGEGSSSGTETGGSATLKLPADIELPETIVLDGIPGSDPLVEFDPTSNIPTIGKE